MDTHILSSRLAPYVKQHSGCLSARFGYFYTLPGVSHSSISFPGSFEVSQCTGYSRSEQVQPHYGFTRMHFLPLCSGTWCFTSEVFVGFLPGRCFQAGSRLNVPCFPASCQQVPFFLLKVFTAAGGRGRRLSKVRTGKGRGGEKKVKEASSSLSTYFLCELDIKGNKPNGVV